MMSCIGCARKTAHLPLSFSLFGRKAQKDNFLYKIQLLTGQEFGKENLPNATVCRTCLHQVNKATEIRGNLIKNLKDLTEGLCSDARPTRRSLFPSNKPSNCKPSDRPDHSYSTPLKQYVSIPTCTNSVSPTDHSYSKDSTNADSSDSPLDKAGDRKNHDVLQKALSVVSSKSLFATTENIKDEICKLASRDVETQSILKKDKAIENLVNDEVFLYKVLNEMSRKCPTVLAVLVAICTPLSSHPNAKHINGIVMAYGILMYQHDKQMSAIQRLLTLAAVKGRANEGFITKLNKLGVCLSPSAKLNLLDECKAASEKGIVRAIEENPYAKITGDNLDIYIQSSTQSSEHGNQDVHMFTRTMLFARIPKYHLLSSVKPQVRLECLLPNMFLLTEEDQHLLRNAYIVMVGRIFSSSLRAFEWMADVLPKHIPHQNSEHMSQKTKRYPLPLLDCNESKYDDCLRIMDATEKDVADLFTKAHGSTSKLKENKVIFGGDQLTRIRLDLCRHLRNLAPIPAERFDNIKPIVIEMWHNKQDLLEKAYKELFKPKSYAVRGTLAHYKSITWNKNATGKVKSNFKAHWDMLMGLGKALLIEQAKEYFGMETAMSLPTLHRPPDDVASRPIDEQSRILRSTLGGFLDQFEYGQQFSMEKDTSQDQTADRLYNYCCNFCHWLLHLLELDDTAKEGDLERLLVNCKCNLFFFFSHSILSKYFCENLDFLLKSNHMLSPAMRLRVLEGSFVNVRGGIGNNVEADLAQEHSVRNHKDMIRQLGANKTPKAMLRLTSAADAIASLSTNLDRALGIRPPSGHHTNQNSQKDAESVEDMLRDCRPFRHTPGRECIEFETIKRSPLLKIDYDHMREHMSSTIERLVIYAGAPEDEESEDDSDDEDEGESGDDTLPEL